MTKIKLTLEEVGTPFFFSFTVDSLDTQQEKLDYITGNLDLNCTWEKFNKDGGKLGTIDAEDTTMVLAEMADLITHVLTQDAE